MQKFRKAKPCQVNQAHQKFDGPHCQLPNDKVRILNPKVKVIRQAIMSRLPAVRRNQAPVLVSIDRMPVVYRTQVLFQYHRMTTINKIQVWMEIAAAHVMNVYLV